VARTDVGLHWPYIERPHEPVGIAPFRLALDDERFTVLRRLIAGTRARDLARTHLKRRRLGVDAFSPKSTIASGCLAIARTDTGSPPAGV
jgi:hypothetical protein